MKRCTLSPPSRSILEPYLTDQLKNPFSHTTLTKGKAEVEFPRKLKLVSEALVQTKVSSDLESHKNCANSTDSFKSLAWEACTEEVTCEGMPKKNC